MPSWNVHLAQAEELLRRESALARAVEDRSAFLFGCLLPDIMVGYMVPGIEHPLPYRVTHLTEEGSVPRPREGSFWDAFVAPALAGGPGASGAGADPISDSVRAMTLGAWTHLLTDNLWNDRAGAFAREHLGDRGEPFRVLKQADFEMFGRTRAVSAPPAPDAALIRAAAQFPQYPIGAREARAAVEVARGIAASNSLGAGAAETYRLFDHEMLLDMFDGSVRMAERLFEQRGGAAPRA